MTRGRNTGSVKIINTNIFSDKNPYFPLEQVTRCMILLHFFGLGDVLRRFELEQLTGLNLMGFRPLNLDDLVIWSQKVAKQQHWDADRIHNDVLQLWINQAEEIDEWKVRLKHSPGEVELLAGIGDERSWQRHWESLLRQTPRGDRA